METTIEDLLEQAMTLPNESRSRLADLLVQSPDAGELGSLDRQWSAEAIRRRDEVRAGQVEPIPGEEALSKIRESIR